MIDPGWLTFMLLTNILALFLGGVSEGLWFSGSSDIFSNLLIWSHWLPHIGTWIPDNFNTVWKFASFDFALFSGSPYLFGLRLVFAVVGMVLLSDTGYRVIKLVRGV